MKPKRAVELLSPAPAMPVDELVLESAARLAQSKARGVPAKTWPEFCALLERTLDAVQPLAERAVEQQKQLTAARLKRALPPGIRTAEQQSVAVLFADLREASPRISKNGATARIAKDLRLPPARVRRYLVGQK